MQNKVIYGEREIVFDLSKNSRNKVEITVLPNATIVVKAPETCSIEEVKKSVLKRARWILKNRDEMEMHSRDVLPRQYISGECHFYMGRRYVLKVNEGQVPSVKLMRGSLIVNCRERKQAPSLISDWYRDHAKNFFERRLNEISTSLPWTNKECPPLKLQNMKKQWGSCSPQGRILLNPHLVKAPRECIDYVILHELCHLQEHNHSSRFYLLLDQLMPNWQKTKEKLDSMAEVYLNV